VTIFLFEEIIFTDDIKDLFEETDDAEVKNAQEKAHRYSFFNACQAFDM